MNIYHFSPIATEEELKSAINYIVTAVSEMCSKTIGRSLPITSLTVFTHYPQEFTALKEILLGMGSLRNENNGPRVTLSLPLEIAGQSIQELRIRQPDPYRMQVGCCDLNIDDYDSFKNEFLNSEHPFLREIQRPDYEMIEFFNPDFDVLAYVVSQPA